MIAGVKFKAIMPQRFMIKKLMIEKTDTVIKQIGRRNSFSPIIFLVNSHSSKDFSS